ncbi:hypothetical protein GJ744_000657 [Endocarpon pusillum]|uniref:Uncharacterized protein n=1 Tax=Endocarpon pusillum TaxID=364733 RepID=A0A8H7AD67_9EURO|nr:hypothetical protein GJ744_000657 [Endocarpon pusillum]
MVDPTTNPSAAIIGQHIERIFLEDVRIGTKMWGEHQANTGSISRNGDYFGSSMSVLRSDLWWWMDWSNFIKEYIENLLRSKRI